VRFGVEFGLEIGELTAAHAGAGGVAALGHEARDHAVELHAIVEAFAGKLGDPPDVAGGEIRAQLDHDVAAARKGKGEGLGRVGHGCALLLKGWRRI